MNSKKPFVLVWLTALSFLCAVPTRAIEIHGIDFPDEVQLQDRTLILNGTATRTVWGLKIYVVGLFLGERCQDCEIIMNGDRMPKRIQISMLRKVSEERFVTTIRENIDKNFSAAEKEKFSREMEAFLACFKGGASLEKGSSVTIDLLPGKGMVVGIDDHQFAPIPGDDFYHAMMRLWIGAPLQESIKEGLLGKTG